MEGKLSLKGQIGGYARQCAQEPLEIIYWDGDRKVYDPQANENISSPSCTLHFKSKKAAQQVIFRGSLGFGEAFMDGDIEVKGDLQQVIRLSLHPIFDSCQAPIVSKLMPLAGLFYNYNSIDGAHKAIAYHYDRGNDFYREWLDDSMTYSCAYFKDRKNTLEKAQQDKFEHICRKLMLQPGERLIDIGCGWGGMLIYAALHYQVNGAGYTLSQNQLEYARNWAKQAGVADQVTFHLQDYRKAEGTYDKFVSIGMFEHVGRKYYPAFFSKMLDLLKPGGLGLLHTIGKNDGSPTDSWITTYIFPGGELPQLYDICRIAGRHDIRIIDMENLRYHYHLTLEHWIKRFEQRLEQIRKTIGGSEEEKDRFLRCWRLYLNGCSVNFLHGPLDLYQLTFTRGLANELPLTREHVYAG